MYLAIFGRRFDPREGVWTQGKEISIWYEATTYGLVPFLYTDSLFIKVERGNYG